MLASRRTDQPIAAVIIYSMEGLIEIASRGVPSLVISYVYTPLGLPAPNYKLTHPQRDDSEA
jgi:hypothetical protein